MSDHRKTVNELKKKCPPSMLIEDSALLTDSNKQMHLFANPHRHELSGDNQALNAKLQAVKIASVDGVAVVANVDLVVRGDRLARSMPHTVGSRLQLSVSATRAICTTWRVINATRCTGVTIPRLLKRVGRVTSYLWIAAWHRILNIILMGVFNCRIIVLRILEIKII